MNLHPMKRVTIICESILEDRVVELLHETGAQGHTAFAVRGDGHQGERCADITETANVQIDVILKPALAEALLQRLQTELFADYAMVAYEIDVRVLRPDKF
ncbi:P-II family nitrogen regulator [Prosthecobacter sp.]|uniref:P-II family nitrogen regulator n=1 Tax=Prosthecobacter sp. TaxID=1965333 RepID=UPI0037C97EDB